MTSDDKEEAMIVYQDIESLIDGELGEKKAKAIMVKIKNDTHLQHRYETLKKQKEYLQKWWRQQIQH